MKIFRERDDHGGIIHMDCYDFHGPWDVNVQDLG